MLTAVLGAKKDGAKAAAPVKPALKIVDASRELCERRPCAMLSRTARRLRPALSRARRAHTQSHAASTNRAAQLAAAAAGTAAAAVLLYQSSPRLRRTTPTAEC